MSQAARPFRCVKYHVVEEIADEWDQFVSRDRPHLRAGMLEAVQRSGVLQDLTYFMLYRGDQLAGVAVVYTLPTDVVGTAPDPIKKLVAWIRKRAPGFLWRSMRICGSPISNSSCGVYLSPKLTPEESREAMSKLASDIVKDARVNQSIYFREFNHEELETFARELGRLGFFSVDPWPGTVLKIRWKTFEEYLTALKKRYRKRIRTDFKSSSELEFELLDSFAHLAPQAHRLYQNVLANADLNLEVLNEEFFAAMSDFKPAKLLVARNPKTDEVMGVNLLLFGETHMQNLFIGFDYEQNQRFHIYFSLVEHSLRLAIEHGCQEAYFGQDSYDFKSRLGIKSFGLTGYMKHRVWPTHWMLRASRRFIFPPWDEVDHDVFQK